MARVERTPDQRFLEDLERTKARVMALERGGVQALRVGSPSGAYVEIAPAGQGIALRVVNSSGQTVQEWTAS